MGTIPKLEECRPGIRAAGYNILIAVEPVEEVTKGGIILTTQTTDKESIVQTRGRIVSIGPVAFGYDNFPEGTEPKVGDAVIFGKLAGVRIPKDSTPDGKEYRLLDDKSIGAILEEAA